MRSKDTGLRAVMVTQLVLLLPIMIAMLALVVDCANMSRCKALASSAASEGARYAAANPDLTDSEVEAYVMGAIGLDDSCTVAIEHKALASKDVTLRVGDKSRDSSIERESVTVNVQIPCRRVFTLAVFDGLAESEPESSSATAISSEVK